ncbi:methyltransferase domain-containing protein [Polaribacter aestuariivivens]|uniref:Methyltransferase domain-containing protein n=1 Tax=Polaribacter aestuariivivens TaxID=2304626 RepID=A0A5S3N7P6_9FLAO|nr:methyltransferase domain-containing protein [Polaribacter aestuariivivens]TMM31340.1 methyltransferase domain-containing protein [Polaribacter aestuariivivens]
MNKIYPSIPTPKFKNLFFFELNGWIGRNFFKRKGNINKIPKSKPIYLDIGSGRNYKEGWVHVDFYKTRLRKFWKKYTGHNPDIETDLRQPLFCDNNIIDGIYSGHTLEHLHFNEAYKLLEECFRVLKPGAWLRINVPDLKRVIDFYNGKIEINHFKYKAEAIAHLTQNHGHVSVWDEELLTAALNIVGFKNIKKVKFGVEGTNQFLIKEEEYRREETLVIEAQKPHS